MTRLLPFAVALTLLAVAGCSSGPRVADAPIGEIPSEFPNHTAEQVVAILSQQIPQLERFTAESDAQVRTPQRSGSIGASLRGTADSLLIQVRATLGIDVARVLVTTDSFHVAASINNRYYFGGVDVAEQYVPGASSLPAVRANLLGLLRPDPSREWRVTVQDSAYVLTSVEETTQRYTIDPRIWRVTTFQELTLEGEVLTDDEFSLFDTVNGVVVPRVVQLTSPVYDVAIRFEHDRIDLEPEEVRIRFSVPSDYPRRPLD